MSVVCGSLVSGTHGEVITEFPARNVLDLR